MLLSEALIRLNEVNDFNKDFEIVGEIQRYMKKFDYVDCTVKAMRDNDTDHKKFIIAFKSSKQKLFGDYDLVKVSDMPCSVFDWQEQQKIQNLTDTGVRLFGLLGAFQKAMILKYSVNDIKFSMGLLQDYKE